MNNDRFWQEPGAYVVTAAKSIQSYILSSDKLRDMVGASTLVAGLPALFLELLDSLGLQAEKDYRVMSGAAGNARVLIRNPGAARKALSLWPLLAAECFPGLSVASGLAEYAPGAFGLECMDAAEAMLRADRQMSFPVCPLAGPGVFRFPRSGRPAVEWGRTQDGETGLDAETLSKQNRSEEDPQEISRTIFSEPEIRALGFKDRYHAFPLDFDRIADSDKRYLAVIHADVNGLGKVLDRLRNEATSLDNEFLFQRFHSFSAAITQASVSALRETLRSSPDRFLPCRPLVCAGDDLTLVMPAAHALGFVRDYLLNLEAQATQTLRKAGLAPDSPITAAAGVAFVKKSFPFSQSYELCEGLCKYAKDRTRRAQSAIAFWRITDATAGGWKEVAAREATGAKGLRLTCNPYVVGAGTAEHPSLDALLEGVTVLGACPRGAFRQSAQDLFLGPEEAQRRFRRQLEVMDSGKSEAVREVFARLGAQEPGKLPLRDSGQDTPLLDLLTLLALQTNVEEV